MSPNKFSWTPEKAEDLLKYVQDYKSSCDFKGTDFEADLTCMYTEVRKLMARKKSVHQKEKSRTWARMNMINISGKPRFKRR